jgi:hypothetical protein
LELTDDGTGFCDVCHEGVGIRGMRERLRELSGSLYIESRQGAESSVTATMPLMPGQADFDLGAGENYVPLTTPVDHFGRILLIEYFLRSLPSSFRSFCQKQPQKANRKANCMNRGVVSVERYLPNCVGS